MITWEELAARCREIHEEMEAAKAKYRRTNPIIVAYVKAMAAERKKPAQPRVLLVRPDALGRAKRVLRAKPTKKRR